MKKLMIAPRTLVAMKWIILPLFMGLFSLPSFAKEGFRNYPQDRNNKYRVQGIPVRGSVKDESGTPLAGATVRVKGRDVQTMTNAKGEFSFADLDPTATLVVSYVGYNDLEIEVKNKSELTASLRAAEGSLNQVVVIGYGSEKKKELVSAVNVVNAKDAGANTATSATQLLQGKAAGVQVV